MRSQGIPLILAAVLLAATMDSPDQGARGIPCSTVNLSGASFPLTLQKGAAIEVRRPQTPTPPFPYSSREVTIPNTVDTITLAGTLTIPDGRGPFPAVLRCNDRGVGASTGDPRAATSADFARDARAELDWLRNAPSVDQARVGLLGHSEGGLIASMLAAQAPEVAFVVLLAGPGLPGDQLLVLQNAALARASGAAEADIRKGSETNRQLYTIAKTEPDQAKAAAAMRELPDLNHLFQTAATGRVDEYAAIEETVAPVALETVGRWILSVTTKRPRAAHLEDSP